MEWLLSSKPPSEAACSGAGGRRSARWQAWACVRRRGGGPCRRLSRAGARRARPWRGTHTRSSRTSASCADTRKVISTAAPTRETARFTNGPSRRPTVLLCAWRSRSPPAKRSTRRSTPSSSSARRSRVTAALAPALPPADALVDAPAQRAPSARLGRSCPGPVAPSPRGAIRWPLGGSPSAGDPRADRVPPSPDRVAARRAPECRAEYRRPGPSPSEYRRPPGRPINTRSSTETRRRWSKTPRRYR